MAVGICSRCGQEKEVCLQRRTRQVLCNWCQRQLRPLITCEVCGAERHDVYRSSSTGLMTCNKCYKRHGQPRPTCSRCGHHRVVALRDPEGRPVCQPCARRAEFREVCSICGQKRMVTARTEIGEPICSLCHQTFKRLIVCVQCHQQKPMGKKLGPDQYICHGCVEQNKKGICPSCGHERALPNIVNGQHVCRMCKWASQTGPCLRCGRERPLHIGGYCGGCYGKVRRDRSAARISALMIGMVVYHRRTTVQGRIRGIRTPLNKRGRPNILKTELLVDPIGKRTENETFWPAIHCHQIKHRARRKPEPLMATNPVESLPDA